MLTTTICRPMVHKAEEPSLIHIAQCLTRNQNCMSSLCLWLQFHDQPAPSSATRHYYKWSHPVTNAHTLSYLITKVITKVHRGLNRPYRPQEESCNLLSLLGMLWYGSGMQREKHNLRHTLWIRAQLRWQSIRENKNPQAWTRWSHEYLQLLNCA